MAQSKAQIEANARYNRKTYDRIELKLRKETELNGAAVRSHAKAMGESVNAFLLRAVAETIERDKRHIADASREPTD